MVTEQLEAVPTKGRAAQGERTRARILETAIHVASAEGLEGLTIGRLATELGMSKSGLFAHFGSKEELQLATVEFAREDFVVETVRPALAAPRGLPRLWVLCENWLAYVEGEALPGGCFFTAAALEFDGRPGPVRDRVAEVMREWLDALERAVGDAQREGHLDASSDPAQIAFELHGVAMASNWAFQLFGDRSAFGRSREGMLFRLRAIAVDGAPGLPEARR